MVSSDKLVVYRHHNIRGTAADPLKLLYNLHLFIDILHWSIVSSKKSSVQHFLASEEGQKHTLVITRTGCCKAKCGRIVWL